MPSTKDLILTNKRLQLVYGPFKTGKTFGALTFPRPNVIDFDGGINTLLNPDFVRKHGVKHVEFTQPKRETDSKGVPKNYNAFDAACIYFDEWMKPANIDRFDTWVVDSGTTLIDAAGDKAIMLLGSPAFKGAGSNTYKEAQAYGLVVPKKQDYGAERSMSEQFVRMVKDSGKHVVILAHELVLTDDTGAILSIGPLFTGKSQQDIPIMFDEVYRLTAKPVGTEIKRVIQTTPIGNIKVGSRTGVPDGTEWTFEAIDKVISDIRQEQKKLLANAASQPSA